ncbi:hypothetical protein PPYR_10917 [Photinus pyralis]|uniref:Uncharacterized protein n=2 Tax=Photinus pyralis TaxID=7054 RepID=A0A5N4AHV2_PHOPY|nr:uncharacterized protein LOC116174822 [Photinus pyralis]KAB0796856.1 hypothetical protein PPYR_10917 [Photinus pyralis]
MAKLDDIFGKKKEAAPILDLSKSIPTNKEEFRRLYDKVPDFKMKAEKVRVEDIKIRDKDFKFKTGKKDYKVFKEPYLFQNPIPPEMRILKLADLVTITIDWKMLTTIRPKSKVDEDFFSRLVELGKMELKTAASDRRAFATDPQIRKTKNKAGVVEMRVVSCKECGEDFCNGKACTKFSYEYFTRIAESPVASPTKQVNIDFMKDKKKPKKTKHKSRSKRKKSKRKGRGKSKSKSKSPKKNSGEKP